RSEADVAPYCVKHDIGMVTYGALCRGLLSGAMSADRKFEGDDLRQNDPKFQPPRFAQYLAAVERLDQFARERFDRRVIHLALRWLIDQPGVVTALWGARRPDQLEPVDAIFGWSLSDADQAEIDRILAETVTDPVGPEFMAPPESRPAA
ncbi:MAG: aldo/keto reductase, partial [Halothiobacillus sp.]|nr:aldo/keto reductase [Halothiobacillus sp.]